MAVEVVVAPPILYTWHVLNLKIPMTLALQDIWMFSFQAMSTKKVESPSVTFIPI